MGSDRGSYEADPLTRCLRAARPKSFGRARWAGGHADDLKEGIKFASLRSPSTTFVQVCAFPYMQALAPALNLLALAWQVSVLPS